MGEVQTLDKSNHSLSGLNLSLLLRFSGPVQSVHLLLGIAERPERSFVFDTDIPVFLDEDPVEERLIAQSPVCVISTLVHADDVGKQPERVIEVCPC
ncbi:hypothetical protein [Leucobacter triazinivorans]|uniref:hypothetical protein n=1 Tax=Leucobacter triazinivorans TaxID=1784719 RepID=UPI001F116E01|nr:hypothetical protein [Leucobacter triazinivorans]